MPLRDRARRHGALFGAGEGPASGVRGGKGAVDDSSSGGRRAAGECSVRAGKRLFNLAADADQKTILYHETKEQVALIGSPNQVEAVMSNMQKRVASYAD